MLSNAVDRITFIISLCVHFLLLTLPHCNFNFSKDVNSKELVTRIEIEKIPVVKKINVIDERKLKKIVAETDKINQIDKIESESLETQESLKELVQNKMDEAALHYQDIVRRKIEEKKEYPILARKLGIEGTVKIKFIILSDGQVDNIKVVESSGYKILDKSAVTTVMKCNPFPPLTELNIPRIEIETNLVYVLKKRY